MSHPTARDLFKASYRTGHKRVFSIERYDQPCPLAKYLAEECDFVPIVCRDLNLQSAVKRFNSMGTDPEDIVYVIGPFFPDIHIHPSSTVVFFTENGRSNYTTVSTSDWDILVQVMRSRPNIRYDQLSDVMAVYGARVQIKMKRRKECDCYIKMECYP